MKHNKDYYRSVLGHNVKALIAKSYYMEYLKEMGISDLREMSVLDIGAGNGAFSTFVASLGTERVVSLEPDLSGGCKGRFEVLVENSRKYDQIKCFPQTYQEYQENNPDDKFDLVFALNVINHIDEEACISLNSEKRSFMKYVHYLSLVRSMLSPGGKFAFTDVSPINFWARIVGTHPILRSIEWEIHQTPEIWRRVLLLAGFSKVQINWTPIYPLMFSSVLRWIAGRKPIAYFLTSSFLIMASK